MHIKVVDIGNDERATFATRVNEKANLKLMDPNAIEKCQHGVQKRIWREEYRLKKVTDKDERMAFKVKIIKLRIIRDELQTLLEII